MDHAEKARNLFFAGYNCAQSVFCAYTDVTGLDLETSAKLSSSFGGGFGRMREICGTVSGAAMVLGAARGYFVPGDHEAKAAHYTLVRDFAERFKSYEGTICCRELLEKAGIDENEVKPGGEPEKRTAQYYTKRPCPELVHRAAMILDDMLGLADVL